MFLPQIWKQKSALELQTPVLGCILGGDVAYIESSCSFFRLSLMYNPISNANKLLGLSRWILVKSNHYFVLLMVSYLGLVKVSLQIIRKSGTQHQNTNFPMCQFLTRKKFVMHLHHYCIYVIRNTVVEGTERL